MAGETGAAGTSVASSTNPSLTRTPLPAFLECSHRPPCPGCPRFGEPGIAPAALHALEALAAAHGIQSVPAFTGASTGFRQRARLAIRGRPGAPKLGMFELGSHRVVTIPNCVIHDPLINRVAAVVRRALIDADVAPYVESTHRGIARYLQVVVERASGTAQVMLVGNAATAEPLAAALELIRDRLGDELHSLWFNSQSERTNAILGPHFERWCGPESVIERFGGAAIHYPPGAFGQNNLEIAGRIVEHVRDRVPAGAAVAEFYAGVGAIGLSLLDRIQRIDMNEVAPQSLRAWRSDSQRSTRRFVRRCRLLRGRPPRTRRSQQQPTSSSRIRRARGSIRNSRRVCSSTRRSGSSTSVAAWPRSWPTPRN